jgi:tubulin-folding cofactor B
MADIPLLIKSTNASSERRINPSWTLSHLKSRLETITGIPASAQNLTLNSVPVQVLNEDVTLLSALGLHLQPYAELQVSK